MKRAKVYLYDRLAGRLIEDENGFTFTYDASYLALSDAAAVSLTLPLTEKPYHDTVLFPFFDGLIPEGWLLDIAERSWKINQRDRMSLLLACCKDCIGAVSVVKDLYNMLEEEEGPSDAFVEQVNRNVIEWLYRHIKGFDRSVAEYKFMNESSERL